jgi:DNA-binding IscR family transcriptional regulator
VRGPKGGFELLVPPASLSTSRVLDAVNESVESSPTCLLGDHPCDPSDPCEVHARWITLVEQVLRPMEETSMADLLGGHIEAASDTNHEAKRPLEVISS